MISRIFLFLFVNFMLFWFAQSSLSCFIVSPRYFIVLHRYLYNHCFSVHFFFFSRLDFLHYARNHNRNEQLMRIAEHSGCQLDIELEPYRTLLSSDLSVGDFQGEESMYAVCTLISQFFLVVVYNVFLFVRSILSRKHFPVLHRTLTSSIRNVLQFLVIIPHSNSQIFERYFIRYSHFILSL